VISYCLNAGLFFQIAIFTDPFAQLSEPPTRSERFVGARIAHPPNNGEKSRSRTALWAMFRERHDY
jgi:hypothetical protein